MPLDPNGVLTQEERRVLEAKIDPEGLLSEVDRAELWGGIPQGVDESKVLVVPGKGMVTPEEYVAERDSRFVPRLAKYVVGNLEGTLPHAVKTTLVEQLPPAMTREGYAESHPQEMFDLATFGLIGGVPGGAVGKGIGMTKIPSIGKAGGAVSRLATKMEEWTKPLATVDSALDTPRQVMQRLTVPDMAPHTWKEYVAEFVPLSPETVFKLDKGGAGQQIYRIVDLTEQAKNRFLVDEVSKFLASAGDIKVGSDSTVRVGRALDAKLPVEQLNAQEAKLYGFLKDKFDFLYNQMAQQAADSPEGYKKVAYAASKSYKPTVKVVELDADLKSVYDALASKASALKGNRKLDDLSVDEMEAYKKLNKTMQDVRHIGWVNKLSPGDRQAYSMLRRKVKDYLPHIFDQDELAQTFKNEIDRLEGMVRLETKPVELTKLKNRLKGLYEAVNKMHGGGIVKYQDLPRDFRLRFLDVRKGKQGYQLDAMKAYQTYLYGFAKKFYGDPALKQVGELFKQVEPSLRPYARWFIEDWAGLGPRTRAQQIAGGIASYQWMTKLGMNPRSALVNYTQRLNTIAEVGEKWSMKGWAKGWTDEGKELFRKSGVAQEVPSVMMEGVVPAGMERLRQTLGWLFTKVELGNRKHAFLAGYERALAQGLDEKAAMQAGIDLVHKTQFRYGKVGMPKQLRSPLGRLAFQFWSYPIKQVEFMVKLAKENPLKLAKLLAYAEGGNYLLGEFLNVDMSNAMGVGFNWGEALRTLQEASKGDIRQAYRHIRLVPKESGLLPTGFGPTLDSALEWTKAVERGHGTEEALKAVMPIQGVKLWKAWEAVAKGEPGKYPTFDRRDRQIQTLTGPELLMETLGPKVKSSSRRYEEGKAFDAAGREYDQLIETIVSQIVRGKLKSASELMSKYGVEASDERIDKALENRHIPAHVRRMMGSGSRWEYQMRNK